MKKLLRCILLKGAALSFLIQQQVIFAAEPFLIKQKSNPQILNTEQKSNSLNLSSWHPSLTPFPQVRDPWEWPFSSKSIWNLPLSSDAVYKPANIKSGRWTSAEIELLYQVSEQDPPTRLYAPDTWTHRCNGTNSPTGDVTEEVYIRFPKNKLIPDAAPPITPNNSAAILQPDGKTVVSISSTARCQQGGPVYGWHAGEENIYGTGVTGSSGGSGLSTLGGTVRLGELIDKQPIRHVLRINVWAQKYLYYEPTDRSPGYRWPASKADSYAAFQYGGSNPKLEMGSLLAIPPDVTPESLGLKSLPALKLFYALQNYGAYVADDTAWDVTAFSIEEGVPEEFEQAYGYKYETNDRNSQWFQEYYALIKSLYLVDHHNPISNQKGGNRLAPLAPPFISDENN